MLVTCIGKEKGIFNDTPWYKLYFLRAIDSKNGEGFAPLTVEKRFNGNVTRSAGISCTGDLYESVQVETSYDSNLFLYNGQRKLSALE